MLGQVSNGSYCSLHILYTVKVEIYTCVSCDCLAYAQKFSPQFASCAHAQHRKAAWTGPRHAAERMPKTNVASYQSQKEENYL